MKIAILLALTLSGCDFYFPLQPDNPATVDAWREVPNLDDTADLVKKLQDLYGFAYAEPPRIHTYGGAGLDCHADNKAWYNSSTGHCIDGYYSGGVVIVSDGRGDDSVRRGALAHEVYHYYLRTVEGDLDRDHESAGWRRGGAFNSAADAIGGEYRDPPR